MKTKLERLKAIIEMFIAASEELDISKLTNSELLDLSVSLDSVSKSITTLADAAIDQAIEKLFNLMRI